MSSSAAELKDAIRHILTEEQNKKRAEAGGVPLAGAADRAPSYGAVAPLGSPDDRFRMLRERISLLEDVLVKSEADRAAVYQRCEATTQALATVQMERDALANGMQHSGAINEMAAEIDESRREANFLRDEVARLTAHMNESEKIRRDLEVQLRTLKKDRKRMMAESDGVSLADLHYSNERLSAQLLQLQKQQQTHDSKAQDAEAKRIAQLDEATRQLVNELTALEQRFASATASHEQERAKLQGQLDQQYREFSLERAECDSIVGALGAKIEAYGFRIEALVSENAALRSQLAAAATPSGHLGAAMAIGRAKR